MKSYIVKTYGDASELVAPYSILNEKELKQMNYYGDYLLVYELASTKPLSKKKLKQLGVPFKS